MSDRDAAPISGRDYYLQQGPKPYYSLGVMVDCGYSPVSGVSTFDSDQCHISTRTPHPSLLYFILHCDCPFYEVLLQLHFTYDVCSKALQVLWRVTRSPRSILDHWLNGLEPGGKLGR